MAGIDLDCPFHLAGDQSSDQVPVFYHGLMEAVVTRERTDPELLVHGAYAVV